MWECCRETNKINQNSRASFYLTIIQYYAGFTLQSYHEATPGRTQCCFRFHGLWFKGADPGQDMSRRKGICSAFLFLSLEEICGREECSSLKGLSFGRKTEREKQASFQMLRVRASVRSKLWSSLLLPDRARSIFQGMGGSHPACMTEVLQLDGMQTVAWSVARSPVFFLVALSELLEQMSHLPSLGIIPTSVSCQLGNPLYFLVLPF